MHICLICNGKGKDSQGKPCGLCRLKWNSTRITKREDLLNKLDLATVVRHDPLAFGEFERGWDLESDQASANLTEIVKPTVPLNKMLVDMQNKLVSIAARNAEQRAEFHMQAKTLEKYPETKHIAKFITESYQGLRKAWLLIEKTERMVASVLEGSGAK